jgi:hypothetical protein
MGDTGVHLRAGDQVEMALFAVGYKVGKLKMQLAVAILGGRSEPVLAIVAGTDLIIVPALGKGSLAGINKAKPVSLACATVQAKVKPLEKIRCIVGFDGQLDIVGVAAVDNGDIAAIEFVGDCDWIVSYSIHFTSVASFPKTISNTLSPDKY